MSCPPGKIFNPATGRCVKIDGPIGKKLVAASRGRSKSPSPAYRRSRRRSYHSPTSPSYQRSRSRSVRSPSTPKRRSPPQPKASSKKFSRVSEGYYVENEDRETDHGVYGKVYIECKNEAKGKKCDRILKIIDNFDLGEVEFDNEVRMQKIFASEGFAPNVYKVTKTKKDFSIEMDKIQHTGESFSSYIVKNRDIDDFVMWLDRLARFMCDNGYSHGDMHDKNVMFNNIRGRNYFYLIDYGMASDKGCNIMCDFGKLALSFKYDKSIFNSIARIIKKYDSKHKDQNLTYEYIENYFDLYCF